MDKLYTRQIKYAYTLNENDVEGNKSKKHRQISWQTGEW